MTRTQQEYDALQPPTPDALAKRFTIPREYIRRIAAWMNVSESLLYSIYKIGRQPNPPLQQKLELRCGLPVSLWAEEDLDKRNRLLYTMWYEYETTRLFKNALK
jgi:hypothetical protein